LQGLVIRAATALIEGAAKRTDRMFVLRLECYEVARGEVIDLLSSTWRRLQVRVCCRPSHHHIDASRTTNSP
jgi:hypothetical protein